MLLKEKLFQCIRKQKDPKTVSIILLIEVIYDEFNVIIKRTSLKTLPP